MFATDPRFGAAIPTTAKLIVPFTPKALDPARLRREQEEHLDRDSLAIDRDETALANNAFTDTDEGHAAHKAAYDAIKARREANAQARTDLDKGHARLAQMVGSVPTFMLAVPTPMEREQLQSRLIQMGIQPIGQEQLRATMIMAMFDYDWSEGRKDWSAQDNENAATENADFLDGLWQIEEASGKALTAWQEQEAERILDEWNGAPPREGDRKPTRVISVRDNAKQILLVNTMMQTPIMRAIAAKQTDFERRQRMILINLNLAGVSGVPGYAQPGAIEPGNWTEEEIYGLRAAMDAAYSPALAEKAWNELTDEISRKYILDDFEVKNSDSPLGNTTDLNSSVGLSGASESSDGISKESPSSPTPPDESAPTIVTSSDRISAVETPKAVPSAGPTDGL